MGEVTNIEDHRPQLNIQVAPGNVHVIPKAFFEDVVNGKRDITDLEQYKEIVPVILSEWLEDLCGE